jgi:hypothetical protein
MVVGFTTTCAISVLSSLKLRVGIPLMARCTSVFPTNKTDRHDITEILLKMALNTITLTLLYKYEDI